MSNQHWFELCRLAEGQCFSKVWGCFPLPACNLPCMLPGRDSSSLNYWVNVWQLKPMQWRPKEDQLKSTAPPKAIKEVPTSITYFTPNSLKDLCEPHPHLASPVSFPLPGGLQQLAGRSHVKPTCLEAGNKAGQPASQSQAKLKHTSSRGEKNWKLLPCWEPCKWGIRVGMGESPGQYPYLGSTALAPKQTGIRG